MATKHTFKENALRIVAVIGLIAVLLLGAWGIIQLAFFIPTFLSDLANGRVTPKAAQESIAITVPSTVTSAQAFPVTWTHKDGKDKYSYSLSYSCAEGLSAKAPLPTGAAQVVPCNTSFNYINASSTSPLIFTLTGSKAVQTSVKVSATKLSSGAVTVSASGTTTVNPASVTAAPATPVKTPAKTPAKPSTTKYVPSGRTTNLYGLSDLRVQILSNPGTVRAGSQVSLQFAVENVGTNVTPQNWSFMALLPYSPTYTYQSPGQQALYPGDKIIYTLGYAATPVTQGCAYEGCTAQNPYDTSWSYPYSTMGAVAAYGQASTASVSVDPYNLIAESNESNNYAAVSYQVY